MNGDNAPNSSKRRRMSLGISIKWYSHQSGTTGAILVLPSLSSAYVCCENVNIALFASQSISDS